KLANDHPYTTYSFVSVKFPTLLREENAALRALASSVLALSARKSRSAKWLDGQVGLCPLWVISGHSSAPARCPLCPQRQTLELSPEMSASCQKRTSLQR